MRRQKGFTVMELLVVLVGFIGVVCFGGYGWVNNIITVVHSSFNPLTPELVVRFIGIPMFPVGMVMGYL